MMKWLRNLFNNMIHADAGERSDRGPAWYNGYRSYFAPNAPNPYARGTVDHRQWESGYERADETCAW